MTPYNWKFGIETHRPKSSVSFESGKVVIELEPVGIVTSICHNACLDCLEWADKSFMSVATTVVKGLGTSPVDFNTTIQQLCGSISAGITIIRQAFPVRTDIIKLLYLTKVHKTDSDVFTRLVRAKSQVSRRGVFWAVVQCEGCQNRSMFRVDMWEVGSAKTSLVFSSFFLASQASDSVGHFVMELVWNM
jgi:hypothetical protein